VNITRHTTLFFDASVLVAGAYSQDGGSAFLLEACELGAFTAQSTVLVILEALHALESSFSQRYLDRFRQHLTGIDWKLLPVPPADQLQKYAAFIHPKDLHVLASALEGKSEFLLTLDRKHVLAATETVQEAYLPIRILRPGDFIRQYYPLHDEYPSLRPQRG
jgi:predicted nucleic acid-binding protein